MNKRIFILFSVILSVFLFSQQSIAAAPSNSVKTMATILNYLNHFPNDDEKEKLRKIVNSKKATPQEKIIATAIINLQHRATDADKQKLSEVISDSSTSKSAKSIAKIVRGLRHKPSSNDKDVLKKYMW